mgnify:CR=1 FL=1
MNPKHLLTQLDPATKDLVTYDIRSGEVVSRNGRLEEKAKFVYSLQIADAVCFHLREGMPLTKISKLSRMPSVHVIYRWMDIHPDFKERIKRAKEGRGEYLRDKAEDVIDRCVDNDSVKMAKLKFDSYMKLAEKDNPAQYGSTREGNGGGNAPLQIIVQTGIMRDDPITVEVKNERQDSSSNGGDGSSRDATITVEAGGSKQIKEVEPS